MKNWSSAPGGHDIAEFLGRIYRGRHTGTLEINYEDAKKRLYFISGQLYLSSVHPLARVLVSHLSAATKPHPSSHSSEPSPPPAAHGLIRHIAEHLATWNEGTLQFIAGPPIYLLTILPYGPAMFALFLVLGISLSVRMPVTEAYIVSHTSEGNRSTVLGIYFFAAMEIGRASCRERV